MTDIQTIETQIQNLQKKLSILQQKRMQTFLATINKKTKEPVQLEDIIGCFLSQNTTANPQERQKWRTVGQTFFRKKSFRKTAKNTATHQTETRHDP
jgi:hypothetical protein